jgi:hypothetical protein
MAEEDPFVALADLMLELRAQVREAGAREKAALDRSAAERTARTESGGSDMSSVFVEGHPHFKPPRRRARTVRNSVDYSPQSHRERWGW